MKKMFFRSGSKIKKTHLHFEPGQKDFIFESESSKRWNILIILSTLLAVLFCLLIFFGGVGLYVNPHIPKLETKQTDEFSHIRASKIMTSPQNESANIDTNGEFLQQNIAYKDDVYAFYVNWDSNSEQSLRKNIDTIDVLIPQWLSLNAELELESDIQPEIVELAKKNDIKIVPLIHNIHNGKWNQETVHQLLNSPEEQAKLIEKLHRLVKKQGFDGINIDFENLNENDRDLLTQFIKELNSVFHADGLSVSIDVPAANEAFDYKGLEKYVDQMIVMAYDENVDKPGTIASSSWFKEILSKLPKEKLIVALGNYGYDWEWESQQPGESVSFDDVTRLAEKADLNIQWDDMSQTPYLKYMKNNKVHEIWFLDSATFYNQLKMSTEAGAQGIALWRLGSEDPSVWDILKGHKTEELLTIKNGGNIYSTGEGNIYWGKKSWKEGERSLQFDDTGFITNETYVATPVSSEFERLSQPGEKEIVLTFDDGPDPKYTKSILEILKQYQVKASFFIIGNKAIHNQDIVKQIYRDGHEIGIHTFSHPKTIQMSDKQLKLELNSSQRIIQGITGHTTSLYRSPYGDEEAKYMPSHFQRLQNVTQMGYVTVNYDIDSKDWKLRDSKAIVENVLNQVSNSDIILLHDSGGDRQATVEALPEIIKQLQNKGYKFVSVSDLMNQSKSNIMPPVTKVENPILQSYKVMLFTMTNFKDGISILLYSAMFILALRILILGSLALIHKKHVSHPVEQSTPFVSVIIAAYNEEKVIGKTIESILKSNYPNLEVIVINDGSKDQTSLVVSREYEANKKVLLYHKKNGGKASAINLGIRKAKGDILVAIDADTIVPPDTISKLIRHFADENIAAVSGNVRVGNKKNLLTTWQHIEYVTGFNLEKRGFATLNCVPVVPGALGAWRKQVVKELGYFTNDTLAEDTDMTLKILRQGYKVVIDERAYAYTEAPKTIRDFLKQRFRWSFGTLQCFWKHKKEFGRIKHKSLGFIALPNILLFQFIVPFFAPLIDLLFLLGILAGNTQKSLLIFATYLLVDFLVCLVAFRMEKLSIKPLFFLFLQRIVYRYLLLWVTWNSIFTALKGTRVGWGKINRTGDLTEEPQLKMKRII
ncbi:glycosyltransferase [Siminovitchia acidinfaciens]|uniref:Glycosyltransferase n=1 Tax=Siminovitchia acidinfaciens TaxID=2321395 RepID=A0A429XZR2_9BACI|nr:glycosyltransferase [Siminovitchia acidinfaciens]RST74209.1 glycosyltransferase [Siminovitchia acidinfaciens]